MKDSFKKCVDCLVLSDSNFSMHNLKRDVVQQDKVDELLLELDYFRMS